MPKSDAQRLQKAQGLLDRYLFKKNALSRDNATTHQRRAASRGFWTSTMPPFSFVSFMRNYGNKRGLVYKLTHPKEPYFKGDTVFFPNFKQYWGARWKDKKTGRDNFTNTMIRMRNISYAQMLSLQIDNATYVQPDTPLRLRDYYAEVISQINIKMMRKEEDGYYKVLDKLLSKADPQILSYAKKELEHRVARLGFNTYGQYLEMKSAYYDYISSHAVYDDFVRGQDYSFETAFQASPASTIAQMWENIKTAYHPVPDTVRSDQMAPTLAATQGPFSSPYYSSIPLSGAKHWGDKRMHMDLDPNAYAAYTIEGVEASTNRLVGKDGKTLTDGWYQFVVLDQNDAQGKPQIRYYPCSETKRGVPNLAQTGARDPDKQPEQENYNGLSVVRPASFKLKYGKYIAHSEIAGGQAVSAGGAFFIKNGKLKVIEDSSGHYAVRAPKKGEVGFDEMKALKFTADAFAYMGVNFIHHGTLLERWRPFHGTTKIFKKLAGMFTQIWQTKLAKKNKLSPQLAELRDTEAGKKSPTQLLADEAYEKGQRRGKLKSSSEAMLAREAHIGNLRAQAPRGAGRAPQPVRQATPHATPNRTLTAAAAAPQGADTTPKRPAPAVPLAPGRSRL